jgi:hypothetical protein
MKNNSFISKTFLFVIVLLLPLISSAGNVKDYDERIKTVSKAMAEQAVQGLAEEGIPSRLVSTAGNTARWAYNRIPFAPKWKKPFGKIRQEFYEGIQLLHDIANDSELTPAQRATLIEDLAGSIGKSLNEFSNNFADPMDAQFLDSWKNGTSTGEKIGRGILTRLAFPVVAMVRDIKESIWPFDEKKNPITGKVSKFHAPDAIPFFGNDWRLNSVGAGILNDAAIVFSKVMKSPARNPETAEALNALVKETKSSEPVRFFAFNSFTIFMYRAAQVYLFIAPPFQMATEPTVLGGFLTGVFGFVVPLQIVKQLHKSNSGYSMGKAHRRLEQAGIIAPVRWVRNSWNTTRMGWNILWGGSCTRALEEISQPRPRKRLNLASRSENE